MFGVSSLSLDLQSLNAAFDGGWSMRDVLATVYERIEHGGHPNVFTHRVPRRVAFEQLEAIEALRAQGKSLPLFGATFVVKDNIDVAGMPTTAACPAYSYTPERSATVVQRLLDAGALCLGKANMDQFATGLVGTRSPYGACRNVFNAEYISGGSSSGSAVAVAAGLCTFSLGTDTAGSGRVPAALNHIVGIKPTPGLLSNAGVVPACRTLDCVSVFALTCADGVLVREIMTDAARSAPLAFDAARGFRFGTPSASALSWFGDEDAAELFQQQIEQLKALGGLHVEIQWSPFAEAGELLYNGPWVAERVAAVGDFVSAHADQCLPILVDILATGRHLTAADAFAGIYRLEELKARVDPQWSAIDVMLLPTVASIPRLSEVEADPRRMNDRLGVYTRFANLLGCCVTAVPTRMRKNGLPFGVSLVAPAGHDRALDRLALLLHESSGTTMGATGHMVPLAAPSPVPSVDTMLVAVVGAHLSGMPLNHQLTDRGATLACTTHTAACYRLYALPNTSPPKPGLTRVAHDGVAIEVEVWRMPSAEVGAFLALVPPPLAIGNVLLDDGTTVKGFVCEAHAVEGALDISHYGGFRKYISLHR